MVKSWSTAQVLGVVASAGWRRWKTWSSACRGGWPPVRAGGRNAALRGLAAHGASVADVAARAEHPGGFGWVLEVVRIRPRPGVSCGQARILAGPRNVARPHLNGSPRHGTSGCRGALPFLISLVSRGVRRGGAYDRRLPARAGCRCCSLFGRAGREGRVSVRWCVDRRWARDRHTVG